MFIPYFKMMNTAKKVARKPRIKATTESSAS